MGLRQVCREILKEAKKNKVDDLRRFNQIKLRVLSRLSYNKIPKNATIASLASEKDSKLLKKILLMKPVRTISGVAPIALMADPYPCPHTIKGIGPCTYCPGGPGSVFGNVPQSYTGKEPSTRRAIRNNYDPYLGIFNRLEHYIAMGSVPEKTEVILQGGTFPFAPYIYQEYLVKYLFKAMNDFSMLFYNKNRLNKEKFNIFFELPAEIEDDERTERIHQKLLFIKNLDLSDKKILDAVNYLFFTDKGNNKKSNSKKGNNGKLINKDIITQWKKFNEETNNNHNNNLDFNNANNKKSEDNTLNYLTNNKEFNNKTNGNKNYIINNELSNNGNSKNNLVMNSMHTNPNANFLAMKAVIAKVNTQNNPSLSLEQMQKENETAKIRCVGLTIETKSDYGKLLHGNQMLKLGCTRVELGIQSIYDEVLKKTNRGNTVQDNIDSIRILKDLGFKINAHYMPGLPFTTMEMDRKGLRELFNNPDYKPDMLKIYPCMVMPGTKLYDDWKSGKFVPLTTKEAAELIAKAKRFVPEFVRIVRIQRDIPTYATASGVDKTNLRQYVEKLCKEKGIKCRCIRCREAGLNSIQNKGIKLENLKIKVMEYKASHGKEFFIVAEDFKNDILFGYCRLRFPSQFLREEITKDSAIIRELHVYSAAVQIGKKSDDSFQHKGIGKQLMAKAEEIAKQHGKNKIIVLAGIGARQYFAKLGYRHDGGYMAKIFG